MPISNIVEGDTRIFDLVITDAANQPVDITNHIVRYTMKSDPTLPDGDALPNVLGPIDAVITDGPNGLCTITLDSNDTELLNTQIYQYDFQWSDPTVSPVLVTTLERGTVTVTQQVTITNT